MKPKKTFILAILCDLGVKRIGLLPFQFMKRNLLFFVLFVPLLARAAPVDTGDVVSAINTLGLDLYRVQPGDGNLLLSPYSIQNALAMTYAGAAGDTRAEMQRVLHYPADDTAIHGGFAELGQELVRMTGNSGQDIEEAKLEGVRLGTPIEIHLANRLFVQRGYELRAPFLALVKDNYGASPEQLDFAHAPEDARMTINRWAQDNTKGKIRDLIPSGMDLHGTRLALANAVYLRARWAKIFEPGKTNLESFFVHGSERTMVPMMMQKNDFGCEHHDGFTAVSLPYRGYRLQFLILLPDQRDGLAALEGKITPELLAECAELPSSDVILSLPKFKLAPPSISLGGQLQKLGLKTAFDEPRGTANFDRMAPRKPDDYLYISEVFHKAFLSLDEQGTEAAAATAVMMAPGCAVLANPPKPIEVHVDHPFIFAIQHVPSGECLFLGRVTDPRGKG
jgi:serpin B